MKKIDLVQRILTEYQDRIQPSIPSEVLDIAKACGVTPRQVCAAIDIALDILEQAAAEENTLDTAFTEYVESSHGAFRLISLDFEKTNSNKGKK